MFFKTMKKNPLSSSTSRITLGVPGLDAPVFEDPASVVVPFD